MEIHNFHTYKEKHKGSKPWEQKAVMKNKQENNRGEQEGAVYRLQTLQSSSCDYHISNFN